MRNFFIIISLVIIVCLAGICRAEDSFEQDYLFRLEVPYGIGNNPATLISGSTISALLSVESFVHKENKLRVFVQFPECIEIIAPEEIKKGKNSAEVKFKLHTENDIWFSLIDIHIKPNTPQGWYSIKCCLDMDGKEHIKESRFCVITKEDLKAHLRVKSFSMPVDREGNPELKRKENTLIVKNLSNKLSHLFFVQRDPHKEEMVGVGIENSGKFPVTLQLDYNIYDKNSGEAVDWLANLRVEEGLIEKGLHTQLFLEKNKKENVVFKIIGRSGAGGTLPGEYIQKLSVTLFSMREPFIQLSKPLYVKEVNLQVAASTIFAALVSALGIIGVAVFRKRLFTGLTSREYILIALYAVIAFSLVSIPSTVISNILHAVLGPFSFLICGLFNEIVFYMLLISLIVLLPRPGVITCFIFVKFLLGAVLLGNLSVLSVIWYPMRAVILEIVLLSSGIYEKDFHGYEISGYRKNNRLPVQKVLWASFVIAGGDAFLSFISFNIMMFFYRLFYAGWYIFIYVLISGFLYTFIAVPMGLTLGNRLKKVTVD